MHRDQSDELWQKLEYWIGDSEAVNWTEYTTEMVAKGVLIDFTATQWALLDQTLLSKPEYWQQRCTVSLGEDRSAPAIAPDCLLEPTSIGIEMSGITIDVDIDPDNIADHLIGVPGISFEFMDELVTLPTQEAIRYICSWYDRHAQHDRDNVLLKCRALKARFEA